MWSFDQPVTAPTFDVRFGGLFKLESTSIVIASSHPAFSESVDRASQLKVFEPHELLLPHFDHGIEIDLDDLRPLLIYIHEQDHLKTLSSTPVGLLLWRIEQCLAVDASYLRRKLPDVGKGNCGTQLDAWVQAIQGTARSEQAERITDTVRLTALGSSHVTRFLSLLLHRHSHLTIGGFVEAANAAFQYLAVRSGLDPEQTPTWSTNLDPHLPLIRPDQPTLLQIIEASARSRELAHLIRWRVTSEVLDNWYDRSISGNYAPAFEYLGSALGSPVWSKIAIDLALSSPMDVSLGGHQSTLIVEEVLPTFRLERIVAGMRNQIWSLTESTFRFRIFEDLPRAIGLPSAADLYHYLCETELSFEANWGGRWQWQPTEGDPRPAPNPDLQNFLDHLFGGEPHVNFVEEVYRRNFDLRLKDPAHFTTTQKETVHEPLLMFFTDELVVSSRHEDVHPFLPFSAFHHFCDRELGRGQMLGCDTTRLFRYKELFGEWCLSVGFSEELTDGFLRFQDSMESPPYGTVAGSDFAHLLDQLLKWADEKRKK